MVGELWKGGPSVELFFQNEVWGSWGLDSRPPNMVRWVLSSTREGEVKEVGVERNAVRCGRRII